MFAHPLPSWGTVQDNRFLLSFRCRCMPSQLLFVPAAVNQFEIVFLASWVPDWIAWSEILATDHLCPAVVQGHIEPGLFQAEGSAAAQIHTGGLLDCDYCNRPVGFSVYFRNRFCKCASLCAVYYYR